MAVSLEEELNLFKIDFINRNIGKSPTTPNLYIGDIKTLSTKQMYESPEELAIDLIEEVDRVQKDEKYKPRTKTRFVSSTRSFLKFLKRKRKIDKLKLNSFLSSLVYEKLKEEAIPTIDYSKFEKIMSVIPSDTYTGSRDRTIFSLIYYAGITESETINLTHSCLKEHRGNLAVEVQGKYKIRTLTLDAETTKEVKNYLQQKKQKYKSSLTEKTLFRELLLSEEPLFLDKKGSKPICSRQPRRKFQEYTEKAGIKAELHYLRNSYIKSLVDNDKSAEEIAESTGVIRGHAKTLIKLFSKN